MEGRGAKPGGGGGETRVYGASAGVSEVVSESIGNCETELLEGELLGGGRSVRVAEEALCGGLGGLPTGHGSRDEADGGWGSGGAVVHACGVGM